MTKLYCGQHSLPGIEAIIFDKDGTLADSRQFLERLANLRSQRCVEAVAGYINQSSVELLEHLLAIFGVSGAGIDPDGLMAVGTRQANEGAAVEFLLRMGYPSLPAAKSMVAEQFVLSDRDVIPKAPHTPPFPGTQALLQRLSHSGLQIGVLSSDSTANVKEFLHHYDLHPWVHDWQGTEPGDIPKPAPDLLYRLGGRLGVSPARVVIVGDSWVDQALANQAGAAGFISISEPWGRPPIPGTQLILNTWDDLFCSGVPTAPP